MNYLFTLSILGIIGGLLCAVADMLLDMKGKDNRKIGKTTGLIESNWLKMSEWRFGGSIITAAVAVPLYSCGVISLALQIQKNNRILAYALLACIFVGAMGGFFIHSMICIMPIIYKEMMEKADFERAEGVIDRVWKTIKYPFFVLYIILVIGTTALIITAVISGAIDVPLWCVLLNPVVFQLVGLLLRAIKKDWFYDLPSICAASLGLASIGVIGIINLL